MDIAKLKRALRKEFTRNPGKSAVLIALVPVALYFLVPLVVGKDQPTGPSSEVAQVLATSLVDPATVLTPSEPTSDVSGRTGWRQIVEWMEQDPLMASAELSDGTEHPFQFAPDPAALASGEKLDDDGDEDRNAEPSASFNPAQFVLNATLSGSRHRLATISGRTYREGQYLRTSNEEGAELLPWMLSSVGRNHVILERDRKEYILHLQTTGALADGISIHRGAR